MDKSDEIVTAEADGTGEGSPTITMTKSSVTSYSPEILERIERNGTAAQEKRKLFLLESQGQKPSGNHASGLPEAKRAKTGEEILREEELKQVISQENKAISDDSRSPIITTTKPLPDLKPLFPCEANGSPSLAIKIDGNANQVSIPKELTVVKTNGFIIQKPPQLNPVVVNTAKSTTINSAVNSLGVTKVADVNEKPMKSVYLLLDSKNNTCYPIETSVIKFSPVEDKSHSKYITASIQAPPSKCSVVELPKLESKNGAQEGRAVMNSGIEADFADKLSNNCGEKILWITEGKESITNKPSASVTSTKPISQTSTSTVTTSTPKQMPPLSAPINQQIRKSLPTLRFVPIPQQCQPAELYRSPQVTSTGIKATSTGIKATSTGIKATSTGIIDLTDDKEENVGANQGPNRANLTEGQTASKTVVMQANAEGRNTFKPGGVMNRVQKKPRPVTAAGSNASPLNIQRKVVTLTPVNARKLSLDRVSRQERDDIAEGKIEIQGINACFMDLPSPPTCLPQKNNYLNAGLLSTYYKKDWSPSQFVQGSTVEQMTASLNEPLTKATLCPPMPETGFKTPYLQESDFQLPYDIYCYGVLNTKQNFENWVQLEESRRTAARIQKKIEERKRRSSSSLLAQNEPVVVHASWKFKRVKSNTYYGVARRQNSMEDQICECKAGTPLKCATDDCLNRVVFAECSMACGDECMNRRIQKRDWAPGLIQYLTKQKGYGIKTAFALKKGDFILEYVGEVVTAAEFRRRMLEVYANDTHHYCLQLDSGLVIDGHRSGDKGRYVNHSCEPNCEMQKWSVDGLHRMGLFAIQDILPGEELSYDYNFSLYNETEGQPCYCKSATCRGVIGGKLKVSVPEGNVSRRKNTGFHPGTENGVIFFRTKSYDKAAKVLSNRDIKSVQSAKIFLVRNYEKVGTRNSNDVAEDQGAEKVQTLTAGRAERYKAGCKKKQLIASGENPKVAESPKTAGISTKALNKSESPTKVNKNVNPLPHEPEPSIPDVKSNNKSGKKVGRKSKSGSVVLKKKPVKPPEEILPKLEQDLVDKNVNKKIQKENLHAVIAELQKRIKKFSVDPHDLSYLLLTKRKSRKSTFRST